MKIAFYNLTSTVKIGGIETFSLELAKRLAEKGYEITFICGDSPVQIDHPKNMEIFRYPFWERNRFPYLGSRLRKFMERVSFSFHSLPSILKNKEKYDFFCIFKPYDFPVSMLIKKFNKSNKLIFFSGGTEFFPGYKYMAKKMDYLFACSKFNALQIECYCGIKPLILPNGVDIQKFTPLDPDLNLKKKIGLKDEKVIITVCRLVGWKGVQYAIKAIANLINNGFINIKYLIIGDGEYRRELQILSKNLNIDKNVMFLGRVDNVSLPSFYSISDVAVFPSIAHETFGISIAEAMSCAVPVVCTNVGGIPEVVGNVGFLVPPSDDKALSDKIKTLLTDENLRQQMGFFSRKRIVENFSWDIVVDKFLEYINYAQKGVNVSSPCSSYSSTKRGCC